MEGHATAYTPDLFLVSNYPCQHELPGVNKDLYVLNSCMSRFHVLSIEVSQTSVIKTTKYVFRNENLKVVCIQTKKLHTMSNISLKMYFGAVRCPFCKLLKA